MHIILVTGDRNWTDRRTVWTVLDRRAEQYGRLYIVEGGAAGADWCARTWRLAHYTEGRHRGKTFDADWNLRGLGAGPHRNRQMAVWVATRVRNGSTGEVIAFHDDIANSRGTKGMLDLAEKEGLSRKLVRHRQARV